VLSIAHKLKALRHLGGLRNLTMLLASAHEASTFQPITGR
jgi:hypothetical protein